MNISNNLFYNAKIYNQVNFGAKAGKVKDYGGNAHKNSIDANEITKDQSQKRKTGIIASRKKTAAILSKNSFNKIISYAKKLAVAMLIGTVAFSPYSYNTNSKVTTVSYDKKTNLAEIADNFGVNAKIIKEYNNIYDDMLPIDKIKIPSSFDYIEESIRLLSNDIDKTKTIEQLRQKQTEQKKIADVYADDHYIYFSLHLDNTGSKYVNKNEDTLYINVEDFKKLFDIKSGALKDNNNNLDYEWKKLKTNEEVIPYMDFSDAKLIDGQTYKVKTNDIDIQNINLDDFRN